jgi:hypothetical protein
VKAERHELLGVLKALYTLTPDCDGDYLLDGNRGEFALKAIRVPGIGEACVAARAAISKADAALVSRAPQPEQDTQQLVQELTAALQERPDRERTHWAGCHTDPTHRDCAIARLLAALARAPQQEQQQDYDEAKRYLTSLFAQVAPQCKPLPTLSGLATQIDNYIAGLLAAPLQAKVQQDHVRALLSRAIEIFDPGGNLPDDCQEWASELSSLLTEALQTMELAALARADQP